MDNLAERNKFIDLFEAMYDALFTYTPVEEPEEKEDKKSFSLFKRNKIIEEPKKTKREVYLENVYFELKNYLDNILSNQSQEFWTLWRVCQFIRFSEKVLLYKNDPNGTFFVDSEMNADERAFVIRFNDTEIQFKLQLLPRMNIGTITSEDSKYTEAITILVNRMFGKEMKTKIVIVDKYTDLADDSDVYLINQINKYLNFCMFYMFTDILNGFMSLINGGETLTIYTNLLREHSITLN